MVLNIYPYIRLARLDRPIGIWLLLLPGWWAVLLAAGGVQRMNAADWKVFVLFGIGAVLMRAAGCIINDLWDRNLDRRVVRTKQRPLAAGDVSVAGALVFLCVLLVLSLMILWQMNLVTVLLGILSLPFIVAYPLMKRFTWWPQTFLGLTFNFGALMGWSAVTGVPQLPALLLYVGGIFWTLGYDTIYAHQDKEDDALAGIKSSALKLGERSRIWVKVFYAAAFAFMIIACVVAVHTWVAALFLLPAFLYAAMNIRKWDEQDVDSALAVFKSNRDFGLILLAGIAAASFFYSP
ncbi:MAG: 4-hydroxybenzoate octaprenyltransferase [Alphaproteobacteria bacterium]